MTLVEFLTARLDEDDAWPGCDGYGEYRTCRESSDRMGREVEAKRAIVADYERMADDARATRDGAAATYALGLSKAAMHLAAVYSAHPDYDEEWRP